MPLRRLLIPRLLSLLGLLCLALTPWCARAQSGVLVDLVSGQAILEDRADERASVGALNRLVVLDALFTELERRKLSLSDTLTVKEAHAAPLSLKAGESVDFETLLCRSDILSIHAPLNEYTQGLMNAEAFRKMKSEAILLNMGRGPIICEADLADALNNHEILAAGLDVLCEEPMAKDSPLLTVTDQSRLFITPHIAWAAVESRQRLMKIVAGQIRDFF